VALWILAVVLSIQVPDTWRTTLKLL